MNNKQLAQQALDALESTFPKRSTYITEDAYITAWAKHEDVIKALRAAIAQPESEPVAWVGITDEELEIRTRDISIDDPIDFSDGAQWAQECLREKNKALYAVQVRPAYVPLSDDQINAALASIPDDRTQYQRDRLIARVIEKAVREKS